MLGDVEEPDDHDDDGHDLLILGPLRGPIESTHMSQYVFQSKI